MKLKNAKFFKFKLVPSEENKLCLQVKPTRKYKRAMKKLFKAINKIAIAMGKLGETIPNIDFQIRHNEINVNVIDEQKVEKELKCQRK